MNKIIALSYYYQNFQVFSPNYLAKLQKNIVACPYFTINNLNRDFVDTKGFSLVFRRSHFHLVVENFPYFKPYLELALQEECNAFYLNPLLLKNGSRVDPHIDRSLRSYAKTIQPPAKVSVLYVEVPTDIQGGELVLQANKRKIAEIKPQKNSLLIFQGDLTHSVKAVTSPSTRLSLVCEQYSLTERELEEIPEFKIESRTISQKK